MDRLNSQTSHRWLKPSMPRIHAGSRKSGYSTTRAVSSGTIPAWRGTPNLDGKSVRTRAMVR